VSLIGNGVTNLKSSTDFSHAAANSRRSSPLLKLLALFDGRKRRKAYFARYGALGLEETSPFNFLTPILYTSAI
jgi:hypothetical protein